MKKVIKYFTPIKKRMMESDYWKDVNEKYRELVSEFEKRRERSIDSEFLNDIVLEEINLLWAFTNYRIGTDSRGRDIYDGGRLRFARLQLQDGNRDFYNEKHLELDAYLKFEKYLQGDEVGVEIHHLGNSLKDEIRKVSNAEKLKRYLLSKDLNNFFIEVQAIFADIPFAINKSKEGYFHSHLHLMLRLIGFDIVSEVSTNIGRIDSVIELSSIIYIIEFKIGSSNKAIEQIKEKKYYQKYQTKNKKIIFIGVNCSSQEKNIISWEIIEK